MDVSSVVSGAVSSALESGGVKQALAIAAMKAAEQSQAAILQLFSAASSAPPSGSGRGQNVNISA
jgi:hypothetical protein